MKNSLETLKKRNALKRKWKRKIDLNSFPYKIKKKCKDCGKIKLCRWQHSFTQTGNPEYRARCDDCLKKYFHRMRTTDKFRNIKNKKKGLKHIERKQWAVNYLGKKCKICGYNKSLAALTFHHRDPDEKEYDVGKIMDWNKKKIIKELKKCDLLCFNCHMELHSKEGI